MKEILVFAILVCFLSSTAVVRAIEKVDCSLAANPQKPKCTAVGYIATVDAAGKDLKACNIYYYCLQYAPGVFVAYKYECPSTPPPEQYFDPTTKKCTPVTPPTSPPPTTETSTSTGGSGSESD